MRYYGDIWVVYRFRRNGAIKYRTVGLGWWRDGCALDVQICLRLFSLPITRTYIPFRLPVLYKQFDRSTPPQLLALTIAYSTVRAG